jgi:LmbE family N-acetylglucosaminyl deacetylase
MEFHQPSAEIFVPDRLPEGEALARVTHLGIGAHQDDLEFMAFDGIARCYASGTRWFGGVTCTNGAGSARAGAFANHTDSRMTAIRRDEQNKAAATGRYGAMIQLDYPSAAVRDAGDPSLRDDLMKILGAARPETVYTHNLADKHATHVGVAVAAIRAMRGLPRDRRPRKVIGCEVWRDLDWLADGEKVLMDVSGHGDLAAALHAAFASQIAGGKRYDLAVLGRRAANATFSESHATDSARQLIVGMDLTPLVEDEGKDMAEYVGGMIDRFRADVATLLKASPGR